MQCSDGKHLRMSMSKPRRMFCPPQARPGVRYSISATQHATHTHATHTHASFPKTARWWSSVTGTIGRLVFTRRIRMNMRIVGTARGGSDFPNDNQPRLVSPRRYPFEGSRCVPRRHAHQPPRHAGGCLGALTLVLRAVSRPAAHRERNWRLTVVRNDGPRKPRADRGPSLLSLRFQARSLGSAVALKPGTAAKDANDTKGEKGRACRLGAKVWRPAAAGR